MKKRTYQFRGQIERPANGKKLGYRWVDGYSETTDDGGILYPWMTFKECQQEAKRDGVKAVFDRALVSKAVQP